MQRWVAILPLLVLTTAAAVAAQETTTGSIAGRVADAQGLAVPGAAVTIVSPQGSRTLTTDSDGRFFAPFLTPGDYEVKVDLAGFSSLDRQNIPGARRATRRSHALDAGRQRDRSGGGQGRAARDRHVVHDNRCLARQRAPEQRSGRPPIQRRALPRARRQQRRSGRPGQPVDCRRQRPREQLRGRRREHHERRLRRARVVLDRVRVARQRPAVRLHQGSAGARPAATRPSTARPPAASSTSSRRAGRTSCAAASSATTGRTASRARTNRSRRPTAR